MAHDEIVNLHRLAGKMRKKARLDPAAIEPTETPYSYRIGCSRQARRVVCGSRHGRSPMVRCWRLMIFPVLS